jgi:SPP1 gp7 family putative phage head morphogenesis protein
MSFREYLPTWLGGVQRAAGEPIPFHPIYTNLFGPGVGNQPDHATLLKENIGVADRATRAIANRVSTLNPQVKVTRRVTGGTTADEILDDHVLKALLDRPHPNISRAQLLRLTTQYIVTVGEAYWYKVGNRLGVPSELHPIPPTNIFPLLSSNIVSGYRVTDGNGRQEDIDADLIVRFYFPDPENPWASEGYLGPSGITADTLKFSGQHLRGHYQHDATPKTVLEALDGADAFTQDQKERFWTMWRKHYHNRVGTDVGIPGILPTGYKLVQMALQTGADIVPLLEFLRDEQLMDFGTPRSILGQVVSGDRSSAEVNQWVFDQYTVLPIANLIADGITSQLAPDFDPALFVDFEKFVSDDKRFNLEQEVADINGKVRSINMVREDRGLDPAPWGDEPVGKIGEMPYDPDAIYDFGSDTPGAIEDEETPPEGTEEEPEEPRSRGNGRDSYFSQSAEWARQMAREKKYVPSFDREMKAVLGIQERSVLKKLKAAEPRGRQHGFAWQSPTYPRPRVSVPQLFDPEEWRSLFERRVEPVRVKAFEAIMAETLGGFGIDDFVFTDEMRLLLKRQGALLIKHANFTTQNMIAKQLDQAIAEGEGIDQIAQRIRGVFRTRRHHARTIARTEVLKASQEAQLASFDLAGVERNQWWTAYDDAVRDAHLPMHGEIRAKGETFDLGGEPAIAPGIGPGHGQLSARNSINCRCYLTPVVEG